MNIEKTIDDNRKKFATNYKKLMYRSTINYS